jgi:hypothetical protein
MEEQQLKSEFNSAIAFLNRINLLVSIADSSAMKLDMSGWYHSLLVLNRELSNYMKAEELKSNNLFIERLKKPMSDYLNIKKMRGLVPIKDDLYWTLNDYEIFLRRIFKDTGMESKMQDDPSRAIVR